MRHKKTTTKGASRSTHNSISVVASSRAADSINLENDNNALEEEVQEVQELWTQGATRVPPVPTREEDKIILVLIGDKHWKELSFGDKSRLPNGVLSALIKENFPGLVKYKGRDEPAWTWQNYKLVPDNPKSWQERLPSRLDRVEEDFWLYFRWAEGKEQEAKRVVHNVTKRIIQDVMYEARIQAVIDYHVLILKKPMVRTEACRKYLTVEQYMQAKPWWAHKTPDVMTSGRRSLALEKKEKRPMHILEAYVEARRSEKDGEDYCSEATRRKLAYVEVVKEKHGQDYDWMHAPIDGAAVHKAGGGKKHGRFLIADGFINTTDVLCDVCASNFESQDEQRPCRRARLDADYAGRIEQLERQLQQEREDRQRELEERERDKEREREEREREKERDREERQQEREAWKKETNYLISALQALQSKLNVQFLPPQPAATDLQLPLLAPSGTAISDTTPACIEAQGPVIFN